MSNIIYIDEDECIGDSLDSINANFEVLNTAQQNFNTLIRSLTAFAASPATTYTSLSTQFRSLSSLIIP